MTNSILTETLSAETVSVICQELAQIAYRLATVRWQLIRPVGNESVRSDLVHELSECITQATIALDNLN